MSWPLLLTSIVLLTARCTAATPAFPATGDPAPTDMEPAADSTYGYTPENPVRVGGVRAELGVQNERAFLNALRGPHGEAVEYERQGSCCGFKTRNALVFDTGYLDIYEVRHAALPTPATLYLNMYDYERPRIPIGFTRAR